MEVASRGQNLPCCKTKVVEIYTLFQAKKKTTRNPIGLITVLEATMRGRQTRLEITVFVWKKEKDFKDKIWAM